MSLSLLFSSDYSPDLTIPFTVDYPHHEFQIFSHGICLLWSGRCWPSADQVTRYFTSPGSPHPWATLNYWPPPTPTGLCCHASDVLPPTASRYPPFIITQLYIRLIPVHLLRFKSNISLRSLLWSQNPSLVFAVLCWNFLLCVWFYLDYAFSGGMALFNLRFQEPNIVPAK